MNIPDNLPACLRFNVLSIDYVRIINCFYDYDYDYVNLKFSFSYLTLLVWQDGHQD